MPYTKEQLRTYWQIHKEIINQKRREKRRLAKLSAIPERVSQNLAEVSHDKPANGKPSLKMANPKLTHLIKKWQTQTNYNCASTCTHSYCSNCWYFVDDKLVNYKGLYD
ncbi:7799_t:CDS:1 [Entrophospora sp. SA101]|nr:2569_t:CDS:1 [Entrophospora sp. SA101]CAJ0761302.1 7799_t:CDS:1 [Entrophospora sp. SA101]CAJ0831189.1 2640_t:CDS:1 [Entrophospora sp. SA101]